MFGGEDGLQLGRGDLDLVVDDDIIVKIRFGVFFSRAFETPLDSLRRGKTGL